MIYLKSKVYIALVVVSGGIATDVYNTHKSKIPKSKSFKAEKFKVKSKKSKLPDSGVLDNVLGDVHVRGNCKTDDDCKNKQFCKIDSYDSICEDVNITQKVPSISSIAYGYNLFKADPLYISDTRVDRGTDGVIPFYSLTFPNNPEYNVKLDLIDYQSPLEINVDRNDDKSESVKVKSMSSSQKFEKQVSSSVKVEASGVFEDLGGLEIGAGVGSSSYSDVSRSVKDEITTVSTMSYANLYQFTVKPKNMRLTKEATDKLKKISKSSTENKTNNWKLFFKEFGTHLVSSGIIGASEVQTMIFNKYKREQMTMDGQTFEDNVKAGIPLLFSTSAEHAEADENNATKELRILGFSKGGRTKGHMDNLANEPEFVLRTLTPICEYIDFKNIDKRSCSEQLVTYCIDVLNQSGIKTNICGYPQDLSFQCLFDEDCSNNKHKCIKNICLGDNLALKRPTFYDYNKNGKIIEKTVQEGCNGHEYAVDGIKNKDSFYLQGTNPKWYVTLGGAFVIQYITIVGLDKSTLLDNLQIGFLLDDEEVYLLKTTLRFKDGVASVVSIDNIKADTVYLRLVGDTTLQLSEVEVYGLENMALRRKTKESFYFYDAENFSLLPNSDSVVDGYQVNYGLKFRSNDGCDAQENYGSFVMKECAMFAKAEGCSAPVIYSTPTKINPSLGCGCCKKKFGPVSGWKTYDLVNCDIPDSECVSPTLYNGDASFINNEKVPWWRVELDEAFSISLIRVYNPYKIVDYKVEILLNKVVVWSFLKKENEHVSDFSVPDVEGNSVKITREAGDSIYLTEVEVY